MQHDKRLTSQKDRRARPLGLILSIIMILGGSIALALPFVADAKGWDWDLRGSAGLQGGTINARTVSADPTGIFLAPQDQRPISLITPPLNLPSDMGKLLVVSVSCPDAPAEGLYAVVRLLWQTEERPDYHIDDRIVRIGSQPETIDMDLPCAASDMHRFGIQFVGQFRQLRIQDVRIPALSSFQKLGHFLRGLDQLELIQGYSVNFVRGPNPLGRRLNYFVMSLLATIVGCYLLTRIMKGRPIQGCTIGAIALVIWTAVDLSSTYQFTQQVQEDLKRYKGRDDTEKSALSHGVNEAWANSQLRKLSEPGATFAVVSDDPFTPVHRLAYLAAPWRTQRDRPADADFIFITRSSVAHFNADKGMLILMDNLSIPVKEVAHRSESVYLLKNMTRGKSTTSSTLTDADSENPISLLGLLLGILVPWFTGMGLVAAFHRERSNIAVVVGAGWLAGQFLVIAHLSLTLLTAGGGHARVLLAALTIEGIILWALVLRRKMTAPTVAPLDRRDLLPVRTSTWQKAGIVVLVGILAVKVWQMGLEHLNVTARPDDAISMWLFKAKSITVLDQLPTDPTDDYYLGGSDPHYPVFLPFIAAWLPMVVGGWEERLATLPWLLCYVNLLLLIGGGLRRWLPTFPAVGAAFVVGSLPLMAMHVVRPGYADLMTAAFLAGSVFYLLTWQSSGRLGDFIVGAIFAFAAACMKREGPPMVAIELIFLVGAAWRKFGVFSRGARVFLAFTAIAAALLVYRVVGFADHAKTASALGYHPGVWTALARHLFQWDTFHSLFCLVAAAMPLLFWRKRVADGVSAALLILCWCGFITAIFVWTPQSIFALNDQTPSRLFLHIVPSIVLVLAVRLGTTFLGGRETPDGKL